MCDWEIDKHNPLTRSERRNEWLGAVLKLAKQGKGKRGEHSATQYLWHREDFILWGKEESKQALLSHVPHLAVVIDQGYHQQVRRGTR